LPICSPSAAAHIDGGKATGGVRQHYRSPKFSQLRGKFRVVGGGALDVDKLTRRVAVC
jgi:hypothetical protein